MSDNIPFRLQREIIKRLPVKSVIRFRLVSKPWNSFITSSEFITGYGIDCIQPQRLLALCTDHRNWPRHRYAPSRVHLNTAEVKLVIAIAIDDDNFYHRKFPITVPVRSKLGKVKVIDCSHGLLCFTGYYRPIRYEYSIMMANLWNPLIRKSVGIILPYAGYDDIIGFGVCPVTNDPMVVNISQPYYSCRLIPSEVKVFTLSSGSWKKFESYNLPRYRIEQEQVVIDRFIYWFARGNADRGGHIMSFDMCNQKFEVIDLPDSLSRKSYLSKLRKSLVVLEYMYASPNNLCGVWIMDGITRSFEKRHTIKLPMRAWTNTLLGFRHGGEPIMQVYDDDDKEAATLKAYDRFSRCYKNLEIYGNNFFVSSYVETLLLLDQEDFHIYF